MEYYPIDDLQDPEYGRSSIPDYHSRTKEEWIKLKEEQDKNPIKDVNRWVGLDTINPFIDMYGDENFNVKNFIKFVDSLYSTNIFKEVKDEHTNKDK